MSEELAVAATTYAVIDENDVVVNVTMWDGQTEFVSDKKLVPYTDDNPAYIGGTYKEGVFLPPPEPEPEV